MTVLIAVEGVLRSGTRMVREGRILFEAIKAGNQRIVFLTNDTAAATEHWLASNGITGHSGILSPSVVVDEREPLRVRQIAIARAMGNVDLVIDADPETIKHCLDIEVAGLLFAHAKTSKPDWRPDATKRTWAEIQEQIQRKKLIEAGKESTQ